MVTTRIIKTQAVTPEISEKSGLRTAVTIKKLPVKVTGASDVAPNMTGGTRKHVAPETRELQRNVQALTKIVEHQQILLKAMMEMIQNHSNALVKISNKVNELTDRIQ